MAVEFVDPFVVVGPTVATTHTVFTCSLCCSLVDADYREAHERFHATGDSRV